VDPKHFRGGIRLRIPIGEHSLTRMRQQPGTLPFLLVASGTVLGLAGTDLVLPAVPGLPREIGGGLAGAQLVIAAFVAGTAAGLLLFGEIGPRWGQRNVLIAALVAYAILSLACAFAGGMDMLIALRFLQGIAASAPAVFAPSIIRVLFSDAGATKALGALGSLESLVPAFAPAVGLWLLTLWGWKASFLATMGLAAALAIAMICTGNALLKGCPPNSAGSYWKLLRNRCFLRYALSHAFVLGGLLIFVFGAPSVIVNAMHGTLSDFIWMQICSVGGFILAANTAGFLVQRFDAEAVISMGTWLAASSALAILAFAVGGGRNPHMLIYLFTPMGVGLGLRGPPGFFRAIVSSGGDDARAASLTILAIMVVSAGGTALAAPFLRFGLVALAVASAASQALAVLALMSLPRLHPR
jgi:DHA1 family bicyclomycin/chloramphenicol resistance-like MFS transporter